MLILGDEALALVLPLEAEIDDFTWRIDFVHFDIASSALHGDAYCDIWRNIE